jgi:glycosyltransferase involved in cell wall biosynthesis
MKNSKDPLLSILIPAFEYPEGLLQILNGFIFKNAEQYEVLVYDNSNDNSIENAINDWRGTSKFDITYLKNIPGIGPVKNWNKLLAAAKGKYSLLMHHDEFPIDSDFLYQLCEKIETFPEVDLFILDCILIWPESERNKRHIPHFIRSLLLRISPTYLYRRNFIGPTASLVCRTKSYPRFDERLIWLVDVDLYVRMFLICRKYMYLPNIRVGSTQGRSQSITAKISNSLKEIHQSEISYLANVVKIKSCWLSNDLLSKNVRFIEFIFWGLMRVTSNIFSLAVKSPTVIKDSVLSAIKSINKK